MKQILVRAIDSVLRAISEFMPSRLMNHWLWFLHKNPKITDTWGHHIRPIHYYDPVPDFQTTNVEFLRAPS